MSLNRINLVECPRDAIQGIEDFISTEKKITYINALLESNLFEYIDFGSFVSPKAVPQMQDTMAVLERLEKKNSTRLLSIVVNEKGAEIANQLSKIDYLGYPFSISETFQMRNTNTNIATSFSRVQYIANLVSSSKQELVVYISMAFGNPYGDSWNEELVFHWVERLASLGVNRFSIADTTSEANVHQITSLFSQLYDRFPTLDFSIHLHSRVESALLKIEAAYEAGCRRFEGAFLGYGGCPFAKDDLVGNVPTELLLDRFIISNYEERTNLMVGFQNMIRTDGV